MITRYIKGDITETELKYIAHGVNCQNTMGSGVAKALFTKWPEVKSEYHKYCLDKPPKYLLGKSHIVGKTHDNKYIFNLFTQENFGYDGNKYVNYSAVVDGFKFILECAEDSRIGEITKLAIPKIGCGLAGGNWTFMEQLINDTISDRIEIWVYDNTDAKRSGKNDIA